MKKGFGKIGIIGLLVLIIGVTSVGLYFGGTKLLSIVAGKDAIFCDDYEWVCCGWRLDEDVVLTVENNQPGSWYRCPTDAIRCEIDYTGQTSGSALVSPENMAITKTATNFKYDCEGIFNNICGYACNEVTPNYDNTVSKGWSGSVEPGTYLFQPRNTKIKMTSTFRMRVYKESLKWCGDASCGHSDTGIVGISVQGADGCTFVVDKSVYNINGQLIKEVTDEQISYTVPDTQCMLAYKSRHVCGYHSEECTSDSECTGHPYLDGTAECNSGLLQVYGCKEWGSAPSDKDILTFPNEEGWQEDNEIYSYGTRCGVIKSQIVQCCPGTPVCGQNSFCDPDTFTCVAQEEAECKNDYDCGTQQICDWTTTELKIPVCSGGVCKFQTIRDIECCYDNNCPTGYLCDIDYTCKESVEHRKTCPYQCCVEEPNYFDRECSGDLLCCPDHTCKANCEGHGDCNLNGICETDIGETADNCSDCEGKFIWNNMMLIMPILGVLLGLAGFGIKKNWGWAIIYLIIGFILGAIIYGIYMWYTNTSVLTKILQIFGIAAGGVGILWLLVISGGGLLLLTLASMLIGRK